MEIIQALPTKFVCQLTVVLSDKIQIIEAAVPSGRTSLPFAAVSSANLFEQSYVLSPCVCNLNKSKTR